MLAVLLAGALAALAVVFVSGGAAGMRLRPRATWVVVVAVALVVGTAGRADAADPVAFDTATGHCAANGNMSTYSSSSQPEAHQKILVRLTVPAGADGNWHPAVNGDFGLPGYSIGPQDIVWAEGGSSVAGHALEGSISCYTVFDYMVDFLDPPATPATFTGRISPGSTPSELVVLVPGTTQYVADIGVSQGTVVVGARQEVIVTRGVYNMGTLSPGTFHGLRVAATDGPQAIWTATIRAIPVQVSNLAWNRRAARPGQVLTASYATNGTTVLDAKVHQANGETVRTLATALRVGIGEHSLRWDGLNASGAEVRDGQYALNVAGRDPSGFTTGAEAGILVDGTRPTVKTTSRRTLSRMPRRRGFVARITDRTSGVAAARLFVNGRLRAAGSRLIYRPPRGWRRGRTYRLRVKARDRAGNVMTTQRRIRGR